MNDPLTYSGRPLVTTNITQITPVNRYAYSIRDLWISYGLADLFAMLALLLGILAMILSKGSRQLSLSNLLSITRDPLLTPLFKTCSHGTGHVPQETLNSEIMIKRTETGELSLQPKGEVNPPNVVCKSCEKAERRRSSQPTLMKTKTVDTISPM